jgi:hypothetical protein
MSPPIAKYPPEFIVDKDNKDKNEDASLYANVFEKFFDDLKDAKDLQDLADKLGSKKYQTLVYGFGSNHCWVKQMDMNCNLNEHRTLFIHN